MKKKALKGFAKSKHFLERQKQRQVSDLDVMKAISNGLLVEIDHGHNFMLGSLKVTVDLVNNTLITVHPGDPSGKQSKVLSKEEAQKIRTLIEAWSAKKNAQQKKETNDFLEYVSEFSIIKIKE